jgi:two-component system sensor histidine kinase DesK
MTSGCADVVTSGWRLRGGEQNDTFRRMSSTEVKRRRFYLLPPGSPLGWTPYAWLIYLPTFLVEPIARTQAGRAGTFYWAATIAGLVVFLITYFRGYWLRGIKLIPIVAVQTVLAVGFSPFNAGACVFFVYAGAAAAHLDRTRDALKALLVIAGLGALTAALIEAPGFFWITSIGVTLLVGGVNVHFAQLSRTQKQLRLAQDEIAHLAAVSERERIARDLHDVLGHSLSLIVLKAELAAKLVERDSTRAAAEMRDVETVGRRTLQEVRETIRGYRATLEEEATRARSMLKAAGINDTFELSSSGLSRPAEETLALALREAVTNVVRHSGGSICYVRLHRGSESVTLEVEDDGRGSRAPDGSGLRGMRERVEAFGGTVTRSQGRGMKLTVRLPREEKRAPLTHSTLADPRD